MLRTTGLASKNVRVRIIIKSKMLVESQWKWNGTILKYNRTIKKIPAANLDESSQISVAVTMPYAFVSE